MTFRPPAIRQLPPVVQHPINGIWEVVVPIARTNLVSNPSFETNTTSWTAIGGSIARSTTRQYYGAYSLAITPSSATTDGARFDTVSLTISTLYAYSAKVWAEVNVPIKLAVETTGGAELASVTARGLGRWQWIYGYYLETSTTNRRITLRKNNSADTRVIYLDGVQCEAINAGELVSTYIDGDQLGYVPNQQPPAYVWNGTPHASTSTRSGLTRAGGQVYRFKDYGFALLAMVGLGLSVPQNVSTEYARLDGGYDDYTRKPTRQFSLVGQFEGRNYLELRSLRGGLAQLLDRDQSAQDQQLQLRYHLENDCGDIQSDVIALPCKYQGGLDGQMDNHFAQATTITFTQYMPLIGSDGSAGASLGVQSSLTGAAGVAERLANGTWRGISGTINNNVNALLYASDGKLYIGGDFTVPQTRVGSWDGSTFSALGAGLASSVLCFAQGPDGTIYAGGASVTIGGVAGDVTKFTGGAWSTVGATGATTGQVDQMVWASDGNLYAVGTDATTHAVLYRWNGTAWSTLFTGGAGTSFFAIAEGPAGLYIGGNFTNLNGDANQDYIALYSITAGTWSALGTGLNAMLEYKGITLGLDKRIYIIGDFTTAGGVTANHTAVWNGAAWQPLGSGITSSSGRAAAITLADGSILFGGLFTAVNGVTYPDSLARWNGATYVPLDADLPPNPAIADYISSMTANRDGRLAVGYNNSGSTGTVAATTTVTNTGTAKTYPTVVIKGPSSGTSKLWQLLNTTTNRNIYFNYTIQSGETVTLTLQPDNLSLISDFQGNIASKILPGSNIADFFLQPGANTISFFAASSTVTATMSWRPQYASIDDVP